MAPFRVVVLLLLAGILSAAPATAQEALVYQGPVPVRVEGQTVTLPVAVFASVEGAQSDQLLLHVDVNVNDLQPVLLQQLRQAASNQASSCELRLAVQDASIRLNGNQIILNSTIQADIWLCSSVLETAVGGDTFTIDIGAVPEVSGGRLQLAPGTVDIREMNETLRSMGGAALLQNLYADALRRFNSDPRLTSLPGPLAQAGYRYVDVVPGGGSAGANVVRVSVTGPNDLVALVRTLANMR